MHAHPRKRRALQVGHQHQYVAFADDGVHATSNKESTDKAALLAFDQESQCNDEISQSAIIICEH
jgi:hypothetical protein